MTTDKTGAPTTVTAGTDQFTLAGLRIVAVCPMVADYLDKHHDFDDVIDPLTPDIKRHLQTVPGG
ncbi:N-acetyltransferase [Mycolicibacterium helvum]|uniref:Uncharacterized protein n=1 Tax=Mycolicibacterium helvum TaxID=1534349 RepID=A0A7I7T5Z4_9MYCO|nr:N-acetyltransferase [Mycolicibacterium helvum]BBY63909.1 hypothetical protein MHEL_21520 [Mycolicibacterium helvum]